MRHITTLFIALVVLGLSGTAVAQQPPAQAQARPDSSKASKPAKAAPAPVSINLNSATAAELEALPGVGAATAARILEYRQKNGAFKKIEELMNVRGIGEKTFLNLKPMIVVAPPKGGAW